MQEIQLRDAKATLSAVVDQARQGEPSIITRHGRPEAAPGLYYSHPTAWSEMGFGGPASPRGYVRMELDRRDPWEAAESKAGGEAHALRENKHVV